MTLNRKKVSLLLLQAIVTKALFEVCLAAAESFAIIEVGVAKASKSVQHV